MAGAAANPYLPAPNNPYSVTGGGQSSGASVKSTPTVSSNTASSSNPYAAGGAYAASPPSTPTTSSAPVQSSAPTSTPAPGSWAAAAVAPQTTPSTNQLSNAYQSGAGGLGGLTHAIGNAVGSVYHDLKGGLEGYASHPGTNVQGMVQGLLHPGQADQQYGQFVNRMTQGEGPLRQIGTRALYGTTTDPITYLPFGKIAQVTGITPALKFGVDLAKGAVKTGKEAATAAQTATKVKAPLPKLSPKQAKQMNEWAGLNNGYEHAKVPVQVTKTAANIAKPGTYMSKPASLKNQLNKILETSPGLDRSKLESMIPKAEPTKMSSSVVNAQKYGVYPQHLFPNLFNKTTSTVMKETPHEPNFQLRGGQLMVIPHAAEHTAEAAPAATKAAPYAKYAWQSKVGAPIAQTLQHYQPNGIIVAKPILNGLDRVFGTLPGTRDYFKQGVSKMYGARASGANQINNQLKDIFKGTTPEQRTALTHALESTTPGTKLSDPKLEDLRQKVEHLMKQAESTARSKGLLDSSINPAEMGVARYIPHIVADKLNPEGFTSNGRLLKASIDANKERTIPGTINDINNGGKAKFETDALKVLGYHLHQLNNASTAKDLINSALTHAVTPGTEQAGTKLAEYAHDGQTVHLPADEADYLKGLAGTKSETQQMLQKWGNRYRQGVNVANQAMFASNPLIHILNNLGWQTLAHAPSAFPKIVRNIPEAFKGVQPGSKMDEALRHGAMNLSSEIGTKGTVAQRVNDLTNAVDNPFNWRNPAHLIKGAFNQYTHLTPTLEKAYRSGMFQHATQNMGMTPEQASEHIRGIYGGHLAPNTASLAEKSARSVMPFINWTKTAIGSNIKNAGERPWVYSTVAHGLNAANEANTGHGQLQNQNPLYTALPETNAKGWQKYYEPYFPAMDVAKLTKSVAQQGPYHGLLDFAFTRSNPIVKFPIQEATNLQNPFAAPMDQYKVDQYAGNPLIPQWAHNQANTNQFLQDFSLQGVGQPNSNLTPLDNTLTRALGGFINAPNPQGPAKADKYNQRMWKSQYKSWSKKQSQGNQ